MDIHKLFGILFKLSRFRKKRMAFFRDTIDISNTSAVLDIGGTLDTWQLIQEQPRLTLLNIDEALDRDDYPPNVTFVLGSALNIPFQNYSFDVAFSNSVIEHVYTWKNQKVFSSEVRRVARKIWVQTPAREFFLEPHLITPFVHWLPASWQKRLIRNFTVWGLITRPSRQEVDKFIREVRLLNHAEMEALFPDCTIYVEKWFGMPKSYIAYRR